jgi:hypothetical protein
MIAYNKTEKLTLSAWFLRGATDSNEGPGWREYLLDDISDLKLSDQTFDGNRPGYKRDGGKALHNVQCAL